MSLQPIRNQFPIGFGKSCFVQLHGATHKQLTLGQRQGRQFLKDFCKAHGCIVSENGSRSIAKTINDPMSGKIQPLRFPHPGEILRIEFLKPMGITQYKLGMDLKIPHSRVTVIVKGRRSVTPDTALRLSRYFGTSAEFWIGLQQEYDLRKARAESGRKIESQVWPLATYER